jgi:hypothetical protein
MKAKGGEKEPARCRRYNGEGGPFEACTGGFSG